MKIKYHVEASKEVEDAFKWYESQQRGLGFKFIEETEAAIHRIINYPQLHPTIIKDVRRAILPIFPYGIIYSIHEETIEVYSFAHLHRKPSYWKKRLAKG